MKYILTADIGSTFTKLTAFDMEERKTLASARAFTTARNNVAEGFHIALNEIYLQCGRLEFSERLAASSAYGGLKMVSVGLVPSLTSKAAKLAANSAGAKVIKSFSYELSAAEADEIAEIGPDIVLLTGGIDGGNKEVLLANASRIAGINADFSVIVAGNKTVSGDAAEIIKKSSKLCIVTANVMPEFEKLNINPAKDAIRSLFIEKIIEAKGLDGIQDFLTEKIVPTPLMVYDAVTLLSKGIDGDGVGDLLAFDVGGATTDVYSCSEGASTKTNVVYKGIREPFSKRSVEADIGMRYSLPSLAEAAGIENIAAKAATSEAAVREWLEICVKNPEAVPGGNPVHEAVDKALAAFAVEICANRHAGTFETVYTHFGEMLVQNGKDLTATDVVIGSGGVIINGSDPGFILKHALYSPAAPEILKPLKARFYLDKSYILAAMGLVAKKYPQAALAMMKENISEI